MDPQIREMMMQAMMQQQGGMPREHPLSRAFGGTPMYGGVPIQPSQMFDLSGIPGFSGNTPMGQMAGMVMQGVLPGLMGPNFIPGQFSPTQNLFDHRNATQHFMQRRRAVEVSAQADMETYFRLIRGAARMSGVEYAPGGQQEQSARRLASDIGTYIAPILGDIAPDFMDSLHGVRGSAQMLARNIFEGGRYTFDPASGQLGMSGESAGRISAQVTQMLYGPGADLSRMRGLGGQRAGQIYDEMIRRGFGPSVSLDPEESRNRLVRELAQRPDQIASPKLQDLRRTLLGDTGSGSTDLMPMQEAMSKLAESVGRLNPQATEAAMRSFNATQAAQTITRMAGAVSAMRDIFGDMGRPNAPMVELLNGLQSLTQGGLSHMTPGQIERSVRETYAIAKSTGLGLEGWMGMAGTTGQVLDSIGYNRAFAPQIANSAATYGFAFGLSGQPTNFGAIDREQASQLDIRLRTNSLQSPQFSRLSAVMRFADEFARPGGGRGFAPESEAFALSEAVRRGATEYSFTNPITGATQTRSIFQNTNSLQQILQSAGVNQNEAAAALLQSPAAGQRYGQRYDLQALIRQSQAELDVIPTFGAVYARTAGTSMANRRDLTQQQRASLANQFGQTLIRESLALSASDPTLFNAGREGELNSRLGETIQARMGAQLGNMTPNELANMVGSALAGGEAFVQTPGSPFAGYRSQLGVLQMNNSRTTQLQQRTRMEARAIAGLQSALSGLGQTGPVSRLSDAIQNLGPGGGTINDLLRQTLGGIPSAEVSRAAGGLIEHIADLRRQYDDAPRRFGNNPNLLRIEQERITEDIRRLVPDLNRAMQADLTHFSPDAQRILSTIRPDDMPETVTPAPLTPAQEQTMDARKLLSEARETAMGNVPAVATARVNATAASQRAQGARSGLQAAINTIEVRAWRERLTQAGIRRSGLQRQIDAAVARGDTTEANRLRAEYADAVTVEQRAQAQFGAAVQSAEGGVGVNALSTANASAQADAERANSELGVQERLAAPQVDSDPAVVAARARLEAAQGAPGGALPGAPGTSPMSNTGPGLNEMSGRDVSISGNNVNLASNRTTFNDATVELNARIVRLNRNEIEVSPFTVPDNIGDSPMPDAASGATATTRMIGTLRLEGLTEAILEARARETEGATNDTRSA